MGTADIHVWRERFLTPNRAIEIHDSEVNSFAVIGDYVVLSFSSAYIHQSEGRPGIDAGSGWTQRARIRIRGNIADGSLEELPCALSSGYLILHGSRFDNAIPIPLNCDGTVELYLISQFGESVLIRGERIILDLMDEAEYVEEFPGES